MAYNLRFEVAWFVVQIISCYPLISFYPLILASRILGSVQRYLKRSIHTTKYTTWIGGFMNINAIESASAIPWKHARPEATGGAATVP